MADDLLKEAQEAFELCQAHEAENRREALDDIRFARLGEQWPTEVRKRRELDARPCQTINVLPTYIRQVVNDGRQNRPSITVHPAADGADEEVADVYNGLIRNIEVTSDADVAYDTALDDAVTHGLGYFRINTEYACDDSFQQDLKIAAVPNPFSVWGDPFSTAADSADWNLSFVADSMRKKDFERKFKGADAVDWDLTYSGVMDPWLTDDQVMVAEYWKREEVAKKIVAMSDGTIIDLDEFEANLDMFQAMGAEVIGSPRDVKSHKVTQYLLTGAEVIETNPWAGKYIPIVPVYGEVVNLEGRRYFRSLVRDAKDAQRNINFWRTAGTEMLALAPKSPWIGPKGAFKTDADKWDTANVENHSYIEYDGATPPQRQPFAGPPAGYIQAVADAANDLKSVIGMHDASMGVQDPRETSGRAILARMKEGDVSTFHFIDNLSRAIRHGGRILIDLIPKVYSVPRMVRVMGADGSPSMVQINQPFHQPVTDPNGQPVMQPQTDPATGQAAQGPDGNPLMQPQVVEKLFDLTVGKYDLTVEAGPSYTTKREEAAQQMIDLAQADPAILPLIGDLLVKNLDWPGAEEIADRLTQARQAQQQGGNGQANAEGQAKLAQIQQEGQLKMEQMQMQHQLAIQQGAQQLEADKAKITGQLQLKREEMQMQMQLKREEAEAELRLAQWTAEQSIRLKGAEMAARADQTTELPEDTIGGGIG